MKLTAPAPGPAAALAAALALSAGAATAAPAKTAAAAPAMPSLIPARLGASVSYHYDANETGPRGATSTRAVLTITRVVNDRVTVTLTPDDGRPTATVARLGANGTLLIDTSAEARTSSEARSAGRTQNPGGQGTDAQGLPVDSPIGGLPGYPQSGANPTGPGAPGTGNGGYGTSGGNGGYGTGSGNGTGGGNGNGGYGGPNGGPVTNGGNGAASGGYGAGGNNGGSGGYGRSGAAFAGRGEADGAEAVRVLAALVGARVAAGANAKSWSFAPAIGSSGSVVAMTARFGESHGAETSVVADGSGEVRLAESPDARAASPSGDGTSRHGQGGVYGGQRGGQSGGQGGQGGGVYGGGQGGGQGGGRGRRGGGQGGYGQGSRAGTSQQQSAPATVTLHVESTFRGGRLVLARGSDTTATHQPGTDAATTVRWTLTAL